MKANYATRTRNPKGPLLCKARTRTGELCQRKPIIGQSRCRLHGGLSPGAPRGPKNGNFKNGDWTTEAIEERRWLRSLVNSFSKSKDTQWQRRHTAPSRQLPTGGGLRSASSWKGLPPANPRPFRPTAERSWHDIERFCQRLNHATASRR